MSETTDVIHWIASDKTLVITQEQQVDFLKDVFLLGQRLHRSHPQTWVPVLSDQAHSFKEQADFKRLSAPVKVSSLQEIHRHLSIFNPTSSAAPETSEQKSENNSGESTKGSTEKNKMSDKEKESAEHDNVHLATLERIDTIEDVVKAHQDGVNLLDKSSLQYYLQELVSIKQNVDQLHTKCFTLFEDKEGGKPEEKYRTHALNEHNVLKIKFRDVSIKANEISAKLEAASGPRVLRPKSSPPNFSGNPQDWVAFNDQFRNMVVDNMNVSETDKLILLKQSLKGGSAFALVDRVEITDANWSICWAALKSRFDNNRELAHGHLNQLLKMEPLTKQTSKGLLNLVDTVNSVSTALTRLGLELQSNACQLIISHLILKILDYRTKIDFEKSLKNSTDFQSLETLLKFLTSTAAAIAATENVDSRAGQQNQQKQNPSKPKESQTPNSNGTSHPTTNTNKKKSKSKQKDKAAEAPKSSGQSTRDLTNIVCGFCKSKGHYMSTCSRFLNLTVVQRGEEILKSKRCQLCFSTKHSQVSECKSTRMCATCNRKHHTLLHRDTRSTNAAIESSSPPEKTVTHAAGRSSRGLLPTVLVIVKNKDKTQLARALLDTGSQVTIISEKLVQLLNLPRTKSIMNSFTGPGGSRLQSAKGLTSFQLQSTKNKWKTEVEAIIFPKVTTDLPYQSFDTTDWEHLKFLELADPKFNETGPIDLLLGADIVDAIMGNHRIPGSAGKPSAYLTALGWILYGALPNPGKEESTSINTIVEDESFDLTKFWETEEISTKKPLTLEEKECERHFEENTIRTSSGRYEIAIPFRKNHIELGDSRQIALKRWYAVERRLERNPDLHSEYSKFMNEYLQLGHMSKLSYEEASKTNYTPYYFPHHVVIKLSSTSTKYRIVFDGSAKTSSGISLNETMMVGPATQPELTHQILKFRLYRIALCSDIVKMYRQILVRKDDRDYQRILWRPSSKEPIREYRLNTVSYGTSSAPYLATRVLNQLAKDEAKNFPKAAPVIANSFYVDDLISGCSTVEEALELQRQLIACCNSAGFELKKWSSNNSEVLDHLPQDFRETKTPLVFGETESIKTLGISWNPATDLFSFTGTSVQQHHPTKRNVLSIIAKIFDPLGWLSPCIIKAKIIMQMIWVLKIDWDDLIPRKLLEDEWTPFVNQLPHLQKIQVPRYIGYDLSYICELHGFSDASEKAMSAAVYLRVQNNNKFVCNLIMAKTKVAPIKTISLPRLELTAAVMLVRLVRLVQSALQINLNSIHYWTDSSIVLHWISSSSSKWKTFIANRVAEIQESSTISQWHHVVSAENPSDSASRGIFPLELQNYSLWWNGPPWLQSDKLPIGGIPGSINKNDLEEKKIQITTIVEEGNGVLNSLSKFSKWNTIRKVMGYVLRFTKRARKFPDKDNQQLKLFLSAKEINSAEKCIVKMIQAIAFQREINLLSQGKSVPKDSKLIALYPFYLHGIIRVGGRLKNSNLSTGHKNPIILPSNHHILVTMILHLHKELCHTGTQGVLNRLRCQYWILNGRNTIRNALKKCLVCARSKAQAVQQLMGNLPKARITKSRPFLHTGVDFAGPYQIKGTGTRKTTFYKGWISIFTCLATRAIHLELVSGLSQEDFLLALKRFIARRGKPSDLYSDNGTNFEGANNRMTDDIQIVSSLQSPEIAREIALEGINWNFNPPRAPHFGGLWERMIQSVKSHLHKIILSHNYTFEEFTTILTYVEAVVNSRPLLPLTDDPEDMEALTPAHFLIGSPIIMPPEPDLDHLPMNRLNRYQTIQKQLQVFWGRWSSEYLQTLQTRSKWQTPTENVKVGQLVLVRDDYLPPLQWKLARIKKLHPGTDGLVRVTTLETEGTYEEENGKLRRRIKEFVRPISKISLLPIEETTDTKEEIPAKEKVRLKSSSKMKTTSINSLLLHLLFMICIVGIQPGLSKKSHPHVNLWDTFPHCPTLTSPHHEVPFCLKGIRWLVIQDTGVVCSRQTMCESLEYVNSDGLTCQSEFGSSPPCSSSDIIDLDKIRCQNDTEGDSNIEYLTRQTETTHYCSVGSKTMKQCPHFTDQSVLVPVAIVHNVAYPLQHLNLKMKTKTNSIEAYTCTNCTHNCTTSCSGDKYFCTMFPCVSNTNSRPSQCHCIYNPYSEAHYVDTVHGLVYPTCWGNILAPVRKEDKSKASPSYLCPECTISCTDYGLLITSPEKQPTYIKAVKNPSYISMLTDTKVTKVYFTKNMLSGTGQITIEIWYKDHDHATTFHKECPRIPVCKLIRCYMCMENLGNISCFTVWHWVIISTLGLIISISLMTLIWITKLMFYISWILFWPIRKCLQRILERSRRKRNSPKPKNRRQDPEDPEEGEPLVNMSEPSSNKPAYKLTVKQLKKQPRKFWCTINLIFLFGIISGCESCSNSVSMTSASDECHYSSHGLVKCSIRVNTRVSLSSVGQLSCFKIQDSRNNLLGTLTLETKEVAVKCLKENLYYVPRAVAHCQSVKHCYNPFISTGCAINVCSEFKTNSSITEFEPSMNKLGWSYCQDYVGDWCFWNYSPHCHFYRAYLENPSNAAYEVYSCSEFRYQVILQAELMAGNVTTTSSMTLTTGVNQKFAKINFNLISLSTPPIPLLSKCVIRQNQQSGITDCNARGSYSIGKIGELQCNTKKDAQELNKNCISSINLIRIIADHSGVKCISDIVDPAKIIENFPLPMKLEDGMLLPENDTLKFESSVSTLLEIQMETENLKITKEITSTTCEASFIKITGCYSCLTGSVLTIEAKILESNNIVTFECPSVSFFIPLKLTTEMTKKDIIMKMDEPHVDLKCQLRCSENSVKLQVVGTLDYLSNTDMRAHGFAVSYQPPGSFNFHWTSFFGFSWFNSIIKILIYGGLFLVIVVTLISSVKLILRKLL